MTGIKTISPGNAEGRLKRIYDRIESASGQVDNILSAHSLRPHTLEGHMALYKSVLHHPGNKVDKAFLEALGVFVSAENNCDYCVGHHAAGLARCIQNPARAAEIKAALIAGTPETAFKGKELAAMRYALKLTRQPPEIDNSDVATLLSAGWSDGEVLEINQVIAYFAYANRTVLGLAVSNEGEELGLSPNNEDNRDDWSHK